MDDISAQMRSRRDLPNDAVRVILAADDDDDDDLGQWTRDGLPAIVRRRREVHIQMRRLQNDA